MKTQLTLAAGGFIFAFVFHWKANEAAKGKDPNGLAVVPPARMISVIFGLIGLVFLIAAFVKV